jgi:hypothetical protein
MAAGESDSDPRGAAGTEKGEAARENAMDDTVTRLARELADAMAAAVAADPRVEAVRARARAAGYEMKVSLEATVGFAPRTVPAGAQPSLPHARPPRRPFEVNANDRRFLRSLRIAPGDTPEKVEGGKDRS